MYGKMPAHACKSIYGSDTDPNLTDVSLSIRCMEEVVKKETGAQTRPPDGCDGAVSEEVTIDGGKLLQELAFCQGGIFLLTLR
jgi:hypothetical protein